MNERVVYSSFNHYSLVELKKLDPEARTGLLYSEGLVDPWEYAVRVGACAIHPLFYVVFPEMVKGCRVNGIAVNTFTVDQPDYIIKMYEAEVDGIITNVPDVALNIITQQAAKQ
jgi:glycerophosphoryl diester phosphodiesterase